MSIHDSEKRISDLLDDLLDAAMEGEFKEVLDLAYQIRLITLEDKISLEDDENYKEELETELAKLKDKLAEEEDE